MKKFITIILSLVMLFSMAILTTGCANEPEEIVAPVATEEPTSATEDNNEQKPTESNLDEQPIPTPPPAPTEEQIKRFAEAMDVFNLPFDIPPQHSVDGANTAVGNIYRPVSEDTFVEFDIFLMDLIEGHWRLISTEPANVIPSLEWYEFLFTKQLSESEIVTGTPLDTWTWYAMSRFDQGTEQPGAFTSSSLLQPEENRIVLKVYIRLDDHDNILDPRASFTQIITWHFYFDDLNIAVGHFLDFSFDNPSTGEVEFDLLNFARIR